MRFYAVVVMAVLVALRWYGGLELLFPHRSACRVLAEAEAAFEAAMGVALIGMGGKLLVSR